MRSRNNFFIKTKKIEHFLFIIVFDIKIGFLKTYNIIYKLLFPNRNLIFVQIYLTDENTFSNFLIIK